MKRIIFKFAVLFILSFTICFPETFASSSSFEIPDGLVWLNSNRPVKVNDLKGKFVLVYFWSYGGVNIQSMADQCRELQEKYPHELVVISVHTGKALNDDELNRQVANAVTTYRITYPVVIDNELQALKSFHLDRWPSAVLFAPDGSLLFRKTGERDLYYFYSKIIAKNLSRFQASLDKKIIVFQSPENNAVDFPSGSVRAPLTDLSQKVLSPNLMGNVILDDPIAQAMANEAVVLNEQVVLSSEVVEKKIEEDFLTAQNAFTFDFKNFAGEKISLGREYSQKIGTINLKFRLPEQAKLLGDKSYVKVFTDSQKLLAQGVIREPDEHIVLNQEIPDGRLNVEVTLYYCTKTNHAICRIKSILFAVPLASHPNQEDILIEHELAP